MVLHRGHVENHPARVADRHEGRKVKEAVEHFDAVVFVENDHYEGHQTDKDNDYKGIDHGLPDRVPCAVCLLLIDHINSNLYEIQKIYVNPSSKAVVKLEGLTTFTRILGLRSHQENIRREQHCQTYRDYNRSKMIHSVPNDKCRIVEKILLLLYALEINPFV